MVSIKQYWREEKYTILIGSSAGYISFLIASAQGFNFQLFSAQSGLLERFTTNATQLATIEAIKPALVFILIGILISGIIKRWLRW